MPPSPEPFPQTLLARAHPPTVASDLYTERILKRPLYLRATSPQPSPRATRRAALTARKSTHKSRPKPKPRPLSASQKRSLSTLDIPPSQQSYALYTGLNSLWNTYICEILGITDGAKHVTAGSAGHQLASADMHGAGVEVVRSGCVGRVGVRGIVVRDGRGVFDVVGEGGRVRRVPKEGSVFRVRVKVPQEKDEKAGKEGEKEGKKEGKEIVYEIRGEMFKVRGVDRANRKFRMHYSKEM